MLGSRQRDYRPVKTSRVYNNAFWKTALWYIKTTVFWIAHSD